MSCKLSCSSRVTSRYYLVTIKMAHYTWKNSYGSPILVATLAQSWNFSCKIIDLYSWSEKLLKKSVIIYTNKSFGVLIFEKKNTQSLILFDQNFGKYVKPRNEIKRFAWPLTTKPQQKLDWCNTWPQFYGLKLSWY